MGIKQGLIHCLTDARYARGAASRLGTKFNCYFHKRIWRRFHRGDDPINKDWDNMIILDGCRYDAFIETNWLEGTCSPFMSTASESLSYIRDNFIGENFHDIVYVSGNPYLYDIPERTFHAVYSAVETGWDSELETVTPRAIKSKAQMAFHKHPNKRFIMHFMQPHYPFIGPRGRAVEQGGWSPEGDTDSHIWTQLQYGNESITEGRVWELYLENLKLVLETVEELIAEIKGKTVITSDHGNLIGERGFPIPVKGYGHPRHYYLSALVRVPWHVIPGDRRQIVSEPPIRKDTSIDQGVLESRLADLGYR